MKKRPSSMAERSTLEVVEQAFLLLRGLPLQAWTLYLCGSAPFLFLVLYFWTDMSYSAFASRRAAPFAGVLVLAYISMKVFHVFFSRTLLASLSLEQAEPFSPGFFGREFRSQAVAQSAFLLALPAALLTMVPFGWLVAMSEHWPLMSRKEGLMERISGAWAVAKKEPRENHLLIWLTSPLLFVMTVFLLLVTFHFAVRFSPGMQQDMTLSFAILSGVFVASCLLTSPGCAVAACNIGLLVYMLPGLLRTFFGLETSFSLSGDHFFNSTFILSVCVLAYLSVKPLNLAVYAVRHFLTVSLKTGDDLKASVHRHFPMILAAVLAWSLLVPDLRAQTAVAEVPRELRRQELKAAIEESSGQPEYAWRLPKVKPAGENKGLLEDFLGSVGEVFKSIGDALESFFRKCKEWINKWLEKMRPEKQGPSKPFELFDLLPSMDRLAWVLSGLIVATLLFAGWLAYRHRRGRRLQTVVQAEPVQVPDLSDENTTADLLPSDEWMDLAEKLMQEGQYRSALRAMYLGLLAGLAVNGFFSIHPAKSNRDYRQEFRLNARQNHPVCEEFNACVFLFERCWYGTVPVDTDIIREFRSHYEQLRHTKP